jgi:hypothetical protein
MQGESFEQYRKGIEAVMRLSQGVWERLPFGSNGVVQDKTFFLTLYPEYSLSLVRRMIQ